MRLHLAVLCFILASYAKTIYNDLRRKIVACYHNTDHTQADIAALFQVAESTVRNFLRRARRTGSPDALPHAGGRQSALEAEAQAQVEVFITQDNDFTLAELQAQLVAAGQPLVSQSTLCRLLQKLDWPRKKSLSVPANETRRAPKNGGANIGPDLWASLSKGSSSLMRQELT